MLILISLYAVLLCFSHKVSSDPQHHESHYQSRMMMMMDRHLKSSSSSSSAMSSDISVSEVDWLSREAIAEVKKVFQSRMQKFDDFFKELLKTSKRDFHTMFLQTYGLLYERNSYIFTDMFQELEKYYSSGGIELNDVLDSFFHRLYSKMFQVLNAQYTFDEFYLKCVSEKMEELKPFGDIPKKLKIEVRRSFVATRTFVQSMNSAAELFDKISEISMSPDCGSVISVFSSCPSCLSVHPAISSPAASSSSSSLLSSAASSPTGSLSSPSSSSSSASTSPKFCFSVCPAALSKCLMPHSELNEEWNKFVSAMLNLVGRLETSFNIESVIDPIDIKISEAIMNFQENGIEVSHKLFDQCGKPKIGKRDVSRYQQNSPASSRHRSSSSISNAGSSSSSSGNSGSFPIDSTRYNRPPSASPQTSSPGASIERLLEDVKRKVKRSKDYWIRLPTVVCSHRRFASITRSSEIKETHNCWNGSDIITDTALDTTHIHPKRTGGFRSRMSAQSNPLTKQVITRIKLITTKLNYAFNGLDVKWSDEVTDFVNGNGSGSGDSEDDVEEEEDEDDDREEDRFNINHNALPDSSPTASSSSSSSSTPTSTDEIDKAANNKWTTKSPIVTLNYNSGSSSSNCHNHCAAIVTTIIVTTCAILIFSSN